MKTTAYYKLRKPEGTDAVNIEDFNENFDTIDEALKQAADASGDLSRGTVYATTASSRDNVASGESLGTMIGKVMKWFSDMKSGAFATIANNDTVETEGYVLDARVGKTHGDEIDKHTNQLGNLYFGQNSAGKWGYKTSANGTVNPFRNPVGTATAGDVLTGKTFANADADNVTGTMPNNGDLSKTLTPTGDNTVTYTIPAGYTSGGTITADGSTAYAAGHQPITFTVSGSGGEYQYNQGDGSSTITIPSGYTTMTVYAQSCTGDRHITVDGSSVSVGTTKTLHVQGGEKYTIQSGGAGGGGTAVVTLT